MQTVCVQLNTIYCYRQACKMHACKKCTIKQLEFSRGLQLPAAVKHSLIVGYADDHTLLKVKHVTAINDDL